LFSGGRTLGYVIHSYRKGIMEMASNVTRHVLVTDYAWPTLEVEKDGLGKIGAELVVASTGQVSEEPRTTSSTPPF
jgi:hypothetical protein